ncbi:FG-GAP-like repeat-containing protein [Cellulosimicrobium funkei]|uniref:FG-GAP-like repeat-containing protein n=1 Tax=Cellulosimicrobium funkei TaxID=264251 RepID=UPI000AD3FAE2|nr:FG-GAP-like repeat-containing protein [Cellulosimicrobium funkei]
MFRVRRATSLVAGVSAGVVAVVGSVVVPVLGTAADAAAAPVVSSALVQASSGALAVGATEDSEGQPVLEEVPLDPDPSLSGQDEGADGPDGATPFGGTTDEQGRLGTGGAGDVVLSAETGAAGVVVVGVTWEPGTASADLAVEIRTRTGSDWSPWSALEQDLAGAAESDGEPVPDARDGTEPYLAGEVDAVEVALRHEPGDGPADPRLAVVGTAATSADVPDQGQSAPGDTGTAPGTEPSEQTTSDLDLDLGEVSTVAFTHPGASAAAAVVPQAPLAAAVTPRPTIYSRAQWGANEAISTWTPQLGRVVGATVHHTAGTNSYTAAQVPALIRGIYVYHAQSRGWGDIGYNFLVDKYGRVWEGRKGGVDRAIIAAHASGVNSVAFGVSFLGNYDTATVPRGALSAAARVIAWKFSLHGVTAGTTTTINGGRLPTVFGHRDVGQTTCPGQYLYSRLPELRNLVRGLQGDAASRVYQRDLNRDGFPDLVSRTSTSLALATATSAGWQPSTQIGGGWAGSRTIGPGDWNGDGTPDLLRIDSGGSMWLYPGRPDGAFQAPRVISRGWSGLDGVTGGHDWDGDGRADLLARRKADGALMLYPSNGSGGFGPVRKIGGGWGGMTALSTIGKLGDGRPALVARRADGTLLVYRGDGRGSFTGSARVVGGGWQGMTSIVGVGDMNDDGLVDLAARDGAGRLWLYVGDGGGGYRGRSQLGTGWTGFSTVVSTSRSGRGQDLYAVRRDGLLFRYRYDGRGDFSRLAASGVPAAPAVEAIAPGDWDGDGRPDLITRRADGEMYLHAGTGSGSFAAGRRISGGWQVMEQVIGVGNWTGTGVPSLMALDRHTGRIYLYPGDGRGGFAPRTIVATGAGSVDHLVAAGLWRGGRAPDLLTRDTSGSLQLRAGNGAALLGSPVRLGGGWQAYSRIVGVGDVDGDARPDLVGVRPDGSVMLYSGNGRSGFFGWRAYGSVRGVVT